MIRRLIMAVIGMILLWASFVMVSFDKKSDRKTLVIFRNAEEISRAAGHAFFCMAADDVPGAERSR